MNQNVARLAVVGNSTITKAGTTFKQELGLQPSVPLVNELRKKHVIGPRSRADLVVQKQLAVLLLSLLSGPVVLGLMVSQLIFQ